MFGSKTPKIFPKSVKTQGKTQNFANKLKNSSKKLKVSANPLGLLAENRSKKKPGLLLHNFGPCPKNCRYAGKKSNDAL